MYFPAMADRQTNPKNPQDLMRVQRLLDASRNASLAHPEQKNSILGAMGWPVANQLVIIKNTTNSAGQARVITIINPGKILAFQAGESFIELLQIDGLRRAMEIHAVNMSKGYIILAISYKLLSISKETSPICFIDKINLLAWIEVAKTRSLDYQEFFHLMFNPPGSCFNKYLYYLQSNKNFKNLI